MKYPTNANLTTAALTAASATVEAATFCRPDYTSLWQTLSDLAKTAIDRGDADQGAVLWLFADACSMRLKPDDRAEPFIPVTGPGARRSALPNDWSNEERAFLAQAYLQITHPVLRARLADLAWHIAKPRHSDYALAAIDAYRQIPITWDRWLADGRECWARAIQFALMLGQAGESVLGEMESELGDAFFATGVDDARLPLWIAELVNRQSILRDHRTAVAEHLAALADEHAAAGDPRLAQDLLLMAEAIYRGDRDEERSQDMTVKVAELSVVQANWPPGDGESPSAITASHFLEEAYQRLRRLPTEYRGRHGLEQRLKQIESWLAAANQASVQEMVTVETEDIDITEPMREAESAMSGLGTVEAVFKLAAISRAPSKANIESRARQLMREFPMQWLFGSTHLSMDGRVVGKRAPASLDEDDDNALWVAMLQDYLTEVGIITQMRVLPALQTLRREHRLRLGDFINLARRCPLVPNGREEQVGRGLLAGYQGDYATAIHLLVPQLEHMVRIALQTAGYNTQKIGDDGVQSEKGLGSLAAFSATAELLGEDRAFELKALFCEPVGPNLRNMVAHGLLDDEVAGSVYSLYAWWWVLRLVVGGFGGHQAEVARSKYY
ncbi:DUF4209 domain-containing protein [Ectothiorhodosinus mongolicus]|uniref:DUF4209 domain-containing protein n=1 Tax=Ectothiorhodosinus mongolicus TaxID=233100 RepID=UPI000975DFEA|nr:DUF4209 domain-containing protein [Ectothiorhodosinus mongolicus]ULX56753.1 DUF4209 domain-containing protein [Ectothiorhodosinus mongolicus]